MGDYLRQLDEAVSALTADGAPFALERVSVDGVAYRSYASLPPNMGAFFQLMRNHADKEFLVYREERYTFGEALDLAAAFATSLVQDYGVRRGDRVAILSRNNPQWMMAFIGALSIGAVAVPMNAWWTTEELDYGLRDCGARVVVADRQRVERLQSLVGPLGLSAHRHR
jgi:long-chain acyl-CoA synthetase